VRQKTNWYNTIYLLEEEFKMKKVIVLLLSLSLVVVYADQSNVHVIDQFTASEANNIEFLSQGITLTKDASSGTLTSTIVSTKVGFNHCTLAWKGKKDSRISVQIRTSSDQKKWSQWSYAICKKEADLSWKEICRFFQYRVHLQRRGTKAPLLEKISLLYEEATPGMLEGLQDAKKDPNAISNRQIAKPAIVSRREWKARNAKGGYTPHTPRKITIHHTWRPKTTQYAGSSSVRGVQNYHMDSNGWMDIGYHFIIGTYPSTGATKIYQGRPEGVVGAHTGGNNTGNVGVCSIGDHDTEPYHPQTYRNLINLLSWICQRYSISPNNIYGHRDFSSTACPGGILYGKIPQIRKDVQAKLRGE